MNFIRKTIRRLWFKALPREAQFRIAKEIIPQHVKIDTAKNLTDEAVNSLLTAKLLDLTNKISVSIKDLDTGDHWELNFTKIQTK